MQKPKKLPLEITINKTVEKISFYSTIFLFISYAISLPSIITCFTKHQKNKKHPHLTNILITLLGFTYSHLLLYISKKHIINIFSSQIIKKMQRKNETEADRKLRLGNFLGGALYYLSTTVFLYANLYGTELCPSHLGGKMRLDLFNFEKHEMDFFMSFFYFFHLGHHVERLVHLVRSSRESLSFWTMLFHHVITVLLIPLSYMCFITNFGFAIFFLYDVCEIFINFARLFRELRTTKGFFTDLNFIVFYLVWIYNRIYGFNKEVMYFYVKAMLRNFSKVDFLLMYIFLLNLISLSLLNIYWFLQISWAVYLKFVKKSVIPYEEGHVEKEGKRKSD